MTDIVQVEDRFYIHVDSALTDRRTLVLKHDDTFSVCGHTADIESLVHNAHGLYRHDTRFLSRLELRLEGRRLILLGSDLTRDNARIFADYTNPDISDGDRLTLPRGTLHIARSRFLWKAALYERLAVTNFGCSDVQAVLSLNFNADFADLFEIRGSRRDARGQDLDPHITGDSVTLAYQGLDQVLRQTKLSFAAPPEELTRRHARFTLHLAPRQRLLLHFSVHCRLQENPGDNGGPAPDSHRPRARRAPAASPAGPVPPVATSPITAAYQAALADLRTHVGAFHGRCGSDGRPGGCCRIESSNEHMDDWMRRSIADIRSLLTRTEAGPYVCAGVPWYSTPFGRDGIITALQLLWFDPDIARGVLAYLAALQADAEDPENDAEPGKILHERRQNEMARTREIPFAQYYGSVDSTPLFIILAGAYYDATGDHAFAQSIWPNVQRALDWMDRFGDLDGDGFLEYRAHTPDGLANQGWKDSHDSISHADGSLAPGPIAVCEVQAYAYEARLAAAGLAQVLGHQDRVIELLAQAEQLRERFEEAFWLPDLGTYALALDGAKRPCAVRASNAGHCLYSGIASPIRARQVMHTLMSPRMFSGWGIRTLASTEARYDPMSYHNGSIWPHDNALIAAGFARYGFRGAALRLLRAFFDASIYLDLHRLPELFCGFRRRGGTSGQPGGSDRAGGAGGGRGPVPYPVACAPQAWAAGAAFMLLRSCIGLTVDGVRRTVRVRRPMLPDGIKELRLRNLRVGGGAGAGSVDLLFQRHDRDVAVLVLRKRGAVDVAVLK